jgi:hypothetical protein
MSIEQIVIVFYQYADNWRFCGEFRDCYLSHAGRARTGSHHRVRELQRGSCRIGVRGVMGAKMKAQKKKKAGHEGPTLP